VTIDSTPPRRFVPINSACMILTDGGTPRALTAADWFLRTVAGSQGVRDPETFLRVATRKQAIDEAEMARLRWWQPTPEAPLFLHMADVQALRDRFDTWVAEVIPLAERTPEAGSTTEAVPKTPRYRQVDVDMCRAQLVEMMTGNRPAKGQDKATLRDRLKGEFKITGRAFNTAWTAALDDADAHNTWGRAGKRPGRPRP